ncbi:LOB domain-containing protein 24 [Perilla frutescens var. hirtella]|nr:LOB domain-containing protein 24 [Perilla frutescens var. hirtella]
MNSSRCAACKHLRRRCPSDCIFSPYFPSNNPRRFAYVHKIYGASNVGKILQDLPVNCRAQAADTLCYEAYCRIKDPVYGCAGMVSVLHQQLNVAECQLARIKAEIAAIKNETSNVKPHEYQQQVESTALPSLSPYYLPDQSGSTLICYSLPTWFE